MLKGYAKGNTTQFKKWFNFRIWYFCGIGTEKDNCFSWRRETETLQQHLMYFLGGKQSYSRPQGGAPSPGSVPLVQVAWESSSQHITIIIIIIIIYLLILIITGIFHQSNLQLLENEVEPLTVWLTMTVFAWNGIINCGISCDTTIMCKIGVW